MENWYLIRNISVYRDKGIRQVAGQWSRVEGSRHSGGECGVEMFIAWNLSINTVNQGA